MTFINLFDEDEVQLYKKLKLSWSQITLFEPNDFFAFWQICNVLKIKVELHSDLSACKSSSTRWNYRRKSTAPKSFLLY